MTGQSEMTETATLPDPILAFVQAVNAENLHALVDTFSDDALVNDQLRDHWGKAAIAAWARQEVVGEKLRLTVVKAVSHYEHFIVTAHVDGAFDKRGLPDPLELTFYFATQGDNIVRLIILHNQART